MAVKLIPERNEGEEHEEVTLHKKLNHENIVKYIGSRNEDGYFDDFCLVIIAKKTVASSATLLLIFRTSYSPLLI